MIIANCHVLGAFFLVTELALILRGAIYFVNFASMAKNIVYSLNIMHVHVVEL